MSVHPAHLAGENAAELESRSWNGFGERTGKMLKYIQFKIAVDAVRGSLSGLLRTHVLLFKGSTGIYGKEGKGHENLGQAFWSVC